MTQYSFERLRSEYAALWATMHVVKVDAANAQARRIIRNKERYKQIEAATGVLWFVVGVLHMRESSGNFDTYLGNGQSLHRVTTIKPIGRGPFNSFFDGAVDALKIDGLDKIKDWGPEYVAYACEKFNGFGYRHPSRNIPSPYLWGGTSVQKRGKFIRDGVYDPSVMDPQIGAMAVLKQIMALDREATFGPEPVPPWLKPEPPKPPAEPAPSISPKAEDTAENTVKPPVKSDTLWGGFLTTVGGLFATIAGMFQYITTPWGFAAFVVLIAVIIGGFVMVYRGRTKLVAIAKHLANEGEKP